MPKLTDLFKVDLLGEIFHVNMLDQNNTIPDKILTIINKGENAFRNTNLLRLMTDDVGVQQC